MTFQKSGLAVAFIAVVGFMVSCNNASDKSESKRDTTTHHTDDGKDTTTMNKDSDHGLMTAMNSMMDRMKSIELTGDFDIDYCKLMIEHHQGAVDMSNVELSNGSDEKMRSMAQSIITKQTDDIAKLREFVQSYKPSGMKHGEGELKKMLADMQSAMQGMQMTGNTDKDFASMMISHHEEGMKMSKAQLSNGMSQELKNMAKKGISHETKEIVEFKTWLSANK